MWEDNDECGEWGCAVALLGLLLLILVGTWVLGVWVVHGLNPRPDVEPAPSTQG